jgi:hypothetical protein
MNSTRAGEGRYEREEDLPPLARDIVTLLSKNLIARADAMRAQLREHVVK